MFKNKNQRIPWLLLIILLISIIIITPFGKSFLEFISPHGNNHFYLINTSNNKLNELTAMNGKIIFGSTTFEYKSINYLAYIEATNLRNAKYIYDFKYAPFTDLSNITQTKLDIPLDNHLTGLTSFTSNSSILNDFIFSAIYSNGTTQSNEVTKIIQFSISGKIQNITDYSVSGYNDAKILDLTQLSNQTYLIITTLGSNEAKNDQSLHLIWYDLNKNSNKILELSFGPDSLAYDSVNNYIFASDGNSIVKLNDTGKILNKINLDLKPSQISFVNSSFLLFVYYENNLTHLELVLVSVGIVILIVLILKYKKINFRSRKIY